MSKTFWPEKRIALLRQLYQDGVSLREITERLGNQTIGPRLTSDLVSIKIKELDMMPPKRKQADARSHRRPKHQPGQSLGGTTKAADMPREQRESVANAKRALARARQPGTPWTHTQGVIAAPYKESPAPAAAPTPNPKPGLELYGKNHLCQWPYGDPKKEDFHLCGAKAVSNPSLGPYCPFHNIFQYDNRARQLHNPVTPATLGPSNKRPRFGKES